ncbi:MAG TPA: Uma2 family endonuclease [Blastocatellia bacterium]|nr:Uma2 family endonuclease [Blastocatellia bacterium]
MSTQAPSHPYEFMHHLPPGSILTLHDVNWAEYQDLLEAVGEAKGLRISFDEGTLQIMTLSSRHEKYTELIKMLITALSLTLRIRILFFGSVTMQKGRKKGNEPDACFYVQSADLIGNRTDIDFATDPPPDVVVEVDVHHGSRQNFPIYAALSVPEIWHYDERSLRIYHLEDGQYVEAKASLALPLLSGGKLTEYLNRSQKEDQYSILLDFEKWLKSLRKRHKSN